MIKLIKRHLFDEMKNFTNLNRKNLILRFTIDKNKANDKNNNKF